jgi:hypothetical protein
MELTLSALIDVVETSAPTPQPLDLLATASATVTEVTDLTDSLLSHFVDRCRRAGHSWAEIGASLGVTKQAVQKRFTLSRRDLMDLDRLTDRARRVVTEHATTEARRLGHNFIGTEHILLGLFDEPAGVAAVVLTRWLSADDARQKVEAIVARTEMTPAGELPLTPRSARALGLSVHEALQLGHNYVGTEHILLALLREGEGVGARVLSEAGVDDAEVRSAIIAILTRGA